MNLKLIEIWDGNNYTAIISALINHNTELRIRIHGKKLIIKDPRTGFYSCVPRGEPVEVPDEVFIEEDEPVEQETKRCCKELTQEEKQMYKEWGLA